MKEQLISIINQVLEEKLNRQREVLNELRESLFSESKSTAGDKHETGRAMVQLELEQAGKQLHETEMLQQQFSKISTLHPVQPGLGSLIQTNHGWFYLSIPLGKIEWDEQEIFCIGIQAPLSKLFFGKKIGEVVQFGQKSYHLLDFI